MLLSVHVTMLGLLLLMRYYCRNNKCIQTNTMRYVVLLYFRVVFFVTTPLSIGASLLMTIIIIIIIALL